MSASPQIRHGYTLADIDRLARVLATTRSASWCDRTDVADLCWHAIVTVLYEADQRLEPGWLLAAARQHVHRYVRDERREHGIPRDDPWALQGTARHWTRYWNTWPTSTPSPEPQVVERLALAQVWSTLPQIDRDALAALAVHGDYRAAADALGLGYGAFCQRIRTARWRFLHRWHEHETPRPWGSDQRAARGRRRPDQTGESAPTARLTADQVRAIRARYTAGASHRTLAADYGVGRSTIYNLLHRHTWADLDPLPTSATPIDPNHDLHDVPPATAADAP